MEPPMKVTLVSGPVAWKHTPRRGTRKHIQMRITCTRRMWVLYMHANTAPTLVMWHSHRDSCALSWWNAVTTWNKKKNQPIAQMHAAGVAAWWWFKGQTAFSNLTLNNADFLLCDQHMKQIFYRYFSRKCSTFSFICSSFTHMWESCTAPSRCRVQCFAQEFFPTSELFLPWIITVTTDANMYDSVSLYEYPRPPVCQQMPLSKARPADAVELISEEQQKTDWWSCYEWVKWVGSRAYVHTHSASVPLH